MYLSHFSSEWTEILHDDPLDHSIDIRAVCLDLGSYGNRSTRFRDFVVGICESREY